MGGKVGDEAVARGVELRKGIKSETIRIKFMYRGMECRESLKLAHTKANIKYAERLRGGVLNAIERNVFAYADYFPDSPNVAKFGGARKAGVTVGALLRDYLETAHRALSPSTASGYQKVSDAHLFRQWDKMLVTELTPAALRTWIGTLDCKMKTASNILTPLRNVLDQAVNDDLIKFNPLERIKLKKIMPRESRTSTYKPDPFDMAEIAAILAACDGQERNLWRHAFGTGMRPSEYIALEWGSVDWIHHRIHVERVKVARVTKDEAKTVAGLRAIDMTRAAHDALLGQQAYTKLASELVFHDPRYNEGWVGDDPLKKRWTIILRKAGVRYRNPYQTRHTFASVLLAAGANPMYVAKQMGHRTTEMIMRKYGRWIEQGNDEASRIQLSEFFAHVSPTALSRSTGTL
jgi:integrase